MGSQGAIVFVMAIAALAVVTWGAFSARRSITVAIVSILVAVMAAGCGWYAFMESQSLPWSIGYGVFAALSLAVGVKHLVGNRNDSEGSSKN